MAEIIIENIIHDVYSLLLLVLLSYKFYLGVDNNR